MHTIQLELEGELAEKLDPYRDKLSELLELGLGALQERERQERERAFALLEREKSFADLQTYRTQRVETEREAIIPELLDLISGNTPDEVDASIAGLKERSARILESAQSAMQNARKEMTGTRVTTPPLGQMDTNMEQRNFTAEDISSMSMNDYAKYRERIMSDTARGKSRGLFG